MSKALVLFSGGQDSTTCLFWALKRYEAVEAIGFNYGQRHSVELECAEAIAEKQGVRFEVVDLTGVFVGSALVDPSQDVSARHKKNADLPSTFTAGRNAVFLSIAAGRAYERGITELVTGVCQTDYSGYPDCRRNFVNSMESSLELALGKPIEIHTPLMYLTKAETWKLAADLGCLDTIIEETHTDYNGNRQTKNAWGYGKTDNPASVLRANGYLEALQKGWV